MTSRDATTHWKGGLQSGSGRVSLDSSNAGEFDVSFPTRAGNPDGQTSPEELIAAAHSACLAMSLSNVLESAGHAPTSLDVSAEVSLGPDPAGGFRLTGIEITVRGSVAGVTADEFAGYARAAENGCPVSKALSGTTITVDATLDD
jgi:lipoyl-dependent peroxiredoxin